MNVKSFAVGLPGFAGALGTIIATILLIVGLVTDFEGSSGSSSSDTVGAVDSADRASVESTPAKTKPKNKPAGAKTAASTSTPEPEPEAENPGATVSYDEDGNRVETWVEGETEFKKTFYPGGHREITQRELPGFKPNSTLSEDEDGNVVETWIEDGKRHVKTYYPDGTTDDVSRDAEPPGYTRTWSEGGVTYVEKYDGYDNLIERTQSGTPTPPPPPIKPEDPREWDASRRTNYTPVELQQEVERQFSEWNKYRVSKGMKPGQWDEQFANEAQKWADKLAKEDRGTGDFYSVTPHERSYVVSGVDPAYNANYVRLYGMENVWMTDAQNLEAALQKFIESPGHNRNLLLKEVPGKHLHMGIGVAKGAPGDVDWNGRTPYYIVYKAR